MSPELSIGKIIKHGSRITASLGLFASSIISSVDLPKEVMADSGLPAGVSLIDGSGSRDSVHIMLLDWNGASLQMIKNVAQDFRAIAPFDQFDMSFYHKHPSRNLDCDQAQKCNFEQVKRETDEVQSSGLPIDYTMVVVQSNNMNGDGANQIPFPSCTEAPTNQHPAKVVRPPNFPAAFRIAFQGTIAHEHAHQMCLDHEGGDLMERQSLGFNSAHTQFLIAENSLEPFNIRRNTLTIQATQTNGMELPIYANIPGGTNWVKVEATQVDGPAYTMIFGDKAVIEAINNNQFKLSPQVGVRDQILLPDQTGTLRVSVSNETTQPAWESTAWTTFQGRPGLYFPGNVAEQKFRTPIRDAQNITAISPGRAETVATKTPTLRWFNLDQDVFYYEAQLSKDCTFNTDSETAVASVYSMLIHGGLTNPTNSWISPELESGTDYCWRVRPRVQGDGAPVDWSSTFNFSTQSVGGLKGAT